MYWLTDGVAIVYINHKKKIGKYSSHTLGAIFKKMHIADVS